MADRAGAHAAGRRYGAGACVIRWRHDAVPPPVPPPAAVAMASRAVIVRHWPLVDGADLTRLRAVEETVFCGMPATIRNVWS